MTQRGWWDNATREERLAQVRAGAELGMTCEQLAINCGGIANTIHHFARYHNIRFRGSSEAHKNAVRIANRDVAIAGLRLQPVDVLDMVDGLADWRFE